MKPLRVVYTQEHVTPSSSGRLRSVVWVYAVLCGSLLLFQPQQTHAAAHAAQEAASLAAYDRCDYRQTLDSLRASAGRPSDHTAPSAPALAPYHRGIVLYRLRCHAQAKSAFQEAIQADPGTSTAQSAERYLAAIRRREREQQLVQLDGMVGFEYDDNVVLEPDSDAFAFGDQADGRTVLAVAGRLQLVRTAPWRLGVEYNLFQSIHFDLSAFDIQRHTGRLSARLGLRRVTLGAAADYTFTLLDHDRFAAQVTVQPSVTIRATTTLFTVLSVRYRHSDYFNQRIPAGQAGTRDRDGWNVQAGFDQYLVFNQKRSRLRLGYRFEVSRNEGTDWEYDGHHVSLGVHTPCWWGIALDVNGGYTRRDYVATNSFATDGRSRLDDRLAASILLTRRLLYDPIDLEVSAGFVHIDNLSNISLFDYHRNIATIALTGRY